MEINNIINKLCSQLDSFRFKHSINVMEVSEALAKHYGADVHKANISGVLHDCGKNYKGAEALEYVKGIPYEPDNIETLQPKLLHGVIGKHLAKTMYNIDDQEILNAIHWHTTGRAGMDILEKIVYIADYIEPLRSFEGIEEIRKIAFENLDECIVRCSESTIRFIIERGVLLHSKTVETRNYSLCLLREMQDK